MSRLYPGRYTVLVKWTDPDGRPAFGYTEPVTYEDAEKLLLLVGLGVPYEGQRIERALIVGPVADSLADGE